MKIRMLAAVAALSGLLAVALPAHAITYQTVIDTTALAGTNAQLALDFIDGGPPGNSLSIAGFSTNGVLGNQSSTGGVAGALPGLVTMTDSSFFNELLAEITLGTTLSFLFTPSANAPDPGSAPDSFTAFLLDPFSGLPLFATTDPTGANALLQFNIDGSANGLLSVFAAPGQEAGIRVQPALQVPEPGTAALLGLGLLGLFGLRRHRSVRQHRQDGSELAAEPHQMTA